MLGYRDMTFCDSDCMNEDCGRCFTQADHEKAVQWWGNKDYPVALSDFSRNCKDYVKPLDNIQGSMQHFDSVLKTLGLEK